MSDEAKDGTQTSSFKVLVYAGSSTIVLLIVLLLGIAFINEPRVKDALVVALIATVSPGILGTVMMGWKYIDRRGDVSVAKASGKSSAPSTTVNIEQQ
jgi:hypothetical protein